MKNKNVLEIQKLSKMFEVQIKMSSIENIDEFYNKTYIYYERALNIKLKLEHEQNIDYVLEKNDELMVVTKEFLKFENSIFSNKEYFKKLSKLDTSTQEQISFKEKLLIKFDSHGVKLNSDKQKLLKSLNNQIVDLNNEIYTNFIQDKEKFKVVFTDDEVSDYPEVKNIVNSDKEMDFSSSLKALMTLPTKALRKKVWDELDLLSKQNEKIIESVVGLRNDVAVVLGFKSYSEYKLKQTMVGSRELLDATLRSFSDSMNYGYNQYLKKSEDLLSDIPEGFDHLYVSNQFKKNGQLKIEDIYYKEVIEKCLEFINESLDIKIENNDDILEIKDESNKTLGIIKLDLFSKNNKKTGCWVSRINLGDKNSSPLLGLNMNLTSNDMSFPDIRTFMHEMGHAIHFICTKTAYPSLKGTFSIERDAIEIPSMFLENLTYSNQFIKKIFPKLDLKELNQFKKQQNQDKSFFYKRQSALAIGDLRLHDISDTPIRDFYKSFKEELGKDADANNHLNKFMHIFKSGYESTYYGYLWAEIYAHDAVKHCIDHNGDLIKENVLSFKEKFIEKGATQAPIDSFLEFRGQLPTMDGFLHNYQIEKQPKPKSKIKQKKQ